MYNSVMAPLHITLVHDALIPPKNYGGTERVVAWLAKGLVELGHKVTLIARPGSKIEGAEVIACEAKSEWAHLIPANTDLLHLWTNISEQALKTITNKPVLVTIEGNGKPGELFHANTVFVSRRHAAIHGSTQFVYNGLDPAEYEFSSEKQNYAIFLAKASWRVKNLAGAIEIARGAGIELRVMGSKNWPLGLQRYLPAWGGVKYLGSIGGTEKTKQLKNAKALIFPILWEEPFGIAITEALVSGCFVVGTPYGSLPELVPDSVGKLSDRTYDLTNALKEGRYKPERCRDHVLKSNGLTYDGMAKNYVEKYQSVLNQGRLSAENAPLPQLQTQLMASLKRLS